LSISNPAPTNIKNNWSKDGNITLGKLNYRRAVCFLQKQYLKSHTFLSPIVYTVLHILPLIININTHFRVKTTYDEFQSYTKMIHNDNHTLKTTYNVHSAIIKYGVLKSTMHNLKWHINLLCSLILNVMYCNWHKSACCFILSRYLLSWLKPLGQGNIICFCGLRRACNPHLQVLL
jgi:hypothetical protein